MNDTTDPAAEAARAAAELRELCTAWLDDGGAVPPFFDDDPPWFPERRSEIAHHLRAVRTILDRLRQVEEERNAARALSTRVLREAWRNGWTDRGTAMRQIVADSNTDRDAYERVYARYMSENPAEAGRDPFRPLDGPDDPAAPWAAPCDLTPEEGAAFDAAIADCRGRGEQDERDENVRAVAEAVAILDTMLDDDAWAYDAGRARNVLLDNFAGPLAELTARNTHRCTSCGRTTDDGHASEAPGSAWLCGDCHTRISAGPTAAARDGQGGEQQ